MRLIHGQCGNRCIHRILHVMCRDEVPSMELRRRLCLTSIAALFVQRRLPWFGHATPRFFGYTRWRKDWVKVSSELAQHCREVVNSIGHVGSTRPVKAALIKYIPWDPSPRSNASLRRLLLYLQSIYLQFCIKLMPLCRKWQSPPTLLSLMWPTIIYQTPRLDK